MVGPTEGVPVGGGVVGDEVGVMGAEVEVDGAGENEGGPG